jgi:HK97 family phage portal protein
MKILDRLIRKVTHRLSSLPPDDSDWWYSHASYKSITGIGVNPMTAMQCSAVKACVRIIAETISTLPFNVYRRLSRGKELDRDHPVYWLIQHQPNQHMTAVEFWETIMVHILTFGAAYAFVEYNAKQYPISAHILQPDRVTPEIDRETGILFFRYWPPGGESQKILFDDEVLHFPGLSYDGRTELRGLSPIAQHRRTIELAIGQEEYMLRYLANNARPGMYIAHPGKLSEQAQQRIRDGWSAVHAGLQNAGKPGVLEEGMRIETVGSPAKDMEFLAMRKFSIEEIARLYRVPLHMIGSLDRATFSNIEQQSIEWAMHTVRPWCRRIEARVNISLFGPREANTFFAEFNLDGLLRGDSEGRSKYYATMRTAGILTANEIREKENFNPIAGGDDLLVQGAMIPATQAGDTQ